MDRRYVVFLLRFAVAVVVVGVLVYLARPLLCTFIARAARDIVVLTNWLPHLAELSWADDRFRSGTSLAAGRITIEANLFLFNLGFPVAFAAALPGFGTAAWWRRLAGAALLSMAVSALLLASIVDGKATQEVSRLGLRVNPVWRDELVQAAMRSAWDLGALLYPFMACTWLAWVGLLRPPPPRSAPRTTKRGLRPALFAAALVVAGIGSLDRLAERRMQVSASELYAEVVSQNPGGGQFVLRHALRHEQAGRYRMAQHAFALAAGYPRQRREALRGIQRVQKGYETK